MNAMTLNIREMRQYARESIRAIKENRQTLLLSVLFICGLFCGCLMLKNNAYHVRTVAETAVKKLTDEQWSVRLTPILGEVLGTLLIAFFAGFSAVGLPLLLCLPCAKGMIYGAVAAQLYTVYRVKGVVFSLLVLFPFLAAEIAVLVVGLGDSLRMSAALFGVFNGGRAGERGEVKTYCARFLIFTVVSAVIIVLQSFLGGAVGSALLS
ncbi:MAG: stage II sporulation protein M [Clostridia bacterium]|nr:stage II sporulation protein M [Clostridia bacterium]